ncbi:centlein isoform X2 [Ambystoma mexicanum]|uniref:centlein isoform X2 n=1 Tax=Ambystoma mexicanum TaxID=8296 RepID=UPI0037E7B310
MTSKQDEDKIFLLQEEVGNLSEELAQCQADKEFVWSLWKRLQVANPDLTQAISLVVEREKQKAEAKDFKVLEILQVKDRKIQDLDKVVEGQQQELNNLVQRKITVDEENAFLRNKESNLQQKCKDTSQELKDTKERARKKEEQNRAVIKNLEVANEGFSARCADLLNDLEKLRTREAQWKNEKSGIDAKIKSLQSDLTEARQQMDDLHTKNTELSSQLAVKQTELTQKEIDTTRLRKELQELQNLYKQSTEHGAQQAELIQQLQALNMDTQKVLRNQEDAHTAESLSYQKLYNELNAGYEAVKTSETQLRQSHMSLKELLCQKEQQISRLQVQLQEANDALDPPTLGHVEQEPEQPSLTDLELIIASQKSEIQVLQEKLKSANLQLTEQSACNDDAINSTIIKVMTQNKEPPVKRSRSLSPKSSFRESEELRKLKIAERKNEELEKTLQLKSQENAEIRRAHEKRKERLHMIQTNYRAVKQQLKELEEGSNKTPSTISHPRAESWQLRQEDSDAVWNELAHFKKEHKKLLIEKMNLEEELDLMKVHVVMDKATIQELNLCLQEEREELIFRLGEDDGVKNSTPKKSVKDALDQTLQKVGYLERRLKDFERDSRKVREANEELTKERQSLRALVKQLRKDVEAWQHESQELQKSNFEIKKVNSKLEAINKELEKEVGALKKRVSNVKELRLENGKLLRQMQMLQHTMDAAKAAISKATKGKSSCKAARVNVNSKTAKKKRVSLRRHQAFLNQSIKVMSSVFENFNKDGWEDVSGDSDSEVTSSESLGEMIAKTPQMSENHSTDCDGTMEELNEKMHRTALYPQARNHIYHKKSTKQEKCKGPASRYVNIHPSLRLNSSLIRRVSRGMRKGVFQKQDATFPSLRERITSLQQLVAVLQNGKRTALSSARDFRKANEKLTADLNLASQRLQIGKQMAQKMTSDLALIQREKEDLEKIADQLREQLTQAKLSTEVLCPATSSQIHAIPDTASRAVDFEVKQLQSKLKTATNEICKQSMTIKCLKNEIQEREERIRELQEKVARVDRDVNMKRHLIEDLKSRLKANEESAKPCKEMLDNLERKVKTLTEEGFTKKTSMDSLKQRLNVAMKEKSQYEQLYHKVKDHLERKNLKVTDLEGKMTEAESAMTELETTASQQLHGLAMQSGQALEMAQKKLTHANKIVEEFVAFVKALAQTLQCSIQELKRQIRQATKRQDSRTELSKESVQWAQSLAASILNISQSDLDEILGTEDEEFPFASCLMEAVQEKLSEKKRLTEEYYSLVKEHRA